MSTQNCTYAQSLDTATQMIQDSLFQRLNASSTALQQLHTQMDENLKQSILHLCHQISITPHTNYCDIIKKLFNHQQLILNDLFTQYNNRKLELKQQSDTLHHALHTILSKLIYSNNNTDINTIQNQLQQLSQTNIENELHDSETESESEPDIMPQNNPISTDNSIAQIRNLNSVIRFDNKCFHCNKILESQSFFTNHNYFEHNDTSPYKCVECNKSYKTSGGLIGHKKKVHLKLNKCTVCLKTFETNYNLNLHKRTHTNERPFKCHCNKSFKTPGGLTTHIKSIHIKKKVIYQCEKCKNRFSKKQYLKTHECIYECRKCKKTFYKRKKYKKHKKKCCNRRK